MKRALVITAVVLAVLYAGDYLAVRYRIPKSRDPFGTVTVRRYYAVTKKDGNPDFYFQPPQNQTCVHSLFPHLGCDPCWYLQRRSVQRINL